jgi:ankyrin repeat protein
MLVLGSFIVVTRVQAIENMPDGVAQAIATGDIDTLRTILQSTPTAVQARDSDGRTPLHYCGEKPVIRGLYMRQVGKPARNWEQDHKNWLANSKDTADLLLSYGAGVNARDVFSRTPLYFAAITGNIEVAKVLLANKADVNATDKYSRTALHSAAFNGRTAFAKLLIQNGAKVNARDKYGTPLTAAVEKHRDMVELLLNNKADVQMKNGEGFAPIHLAGDKEIAQLLLAHGAKLETIGHRGRTPLHQAAARNRNDIVEWLCSKSVKINTVDLDGQTPLLIAISQTGGTEDYNRNSLETIRILLRYGAEVNYRDKEKQTLLIIAVRTRREDLVNVFLEHGADINAKDKYGKTSLHWAVSLKNKEMVELLVTRGADVNARDLRGRTPLYDTWGGSSADVQISEILKSRGGTL